MMEVNKMACDMVLSENAIVREISLIAQHKKFKNNLKNCEKQKKVQKYLITV